MTTELSKFLRVPEETIYKRISDPSIDSSKNISFPLISSSDVDKEILISSQYRDCHLLSTLFFESTLGSPISLP